MTKVIDYFVNILIGLVQILISNPSVNSKDGLEKILRSLITNKFLYKKYFNIIYFYINQMSDPNDFTTPDISLTDFTLDSTLDITSGVYVNRTNPHYKIAQPVNYKYVVPNQICILRYKDYLNFSIREFYIRKTERDRKHVVIASNNFRTGEIKRIEFYASKSDGSFWRFCIKHPDIEVFDKGYNYISSTFINIYLQKFIKENQHRFEIIEKDIDIITCPDTTKLDTPKYAYLKNRIIGDNYVSNNNFFYVMNTVFPPVTYLKDYTRCISILLTNLSRYISSNTTIEIGICTNIFCELSKQSLIIDPSKNLPTGKTARDVELRNEKSREFFNKIKLVFSSLFLQYFEILDRTKKLIYNKEFIVGSIRFYAKICSVEIKYKINDTFYILYYMIYSDHSDFSGFKKKTILHLIPKFTDGAPTRINIWGLDDRYVAAGLFVNKVFDYAEQAPIAPLEGHDETTTSGYRFIGDLTNYDFLPEISSFSFNIPNR